MKKVAFAFVILVSLVAAAAIPALMVSSWNHEVYCQVHGKYELQRRDCTECTSCTVSDSCCCRHVDRCSCVNPTGEICCQ